MNIEKFELLELRVKEVVQLFHHSKEENSSLRSELGKKEREIQELKERLRVLSEIKKEAFRKVRGILEELGSLGL